MEQSPSWKAKCHLASQEIPHLSWNPTYFKVNAVLELYYYSFYECAEGSSAYVYVQCVS
jgi:hypothetical protein